MPPILRNIAIIGGAAMAIGSVIAAEWVTLASSDAPPSIMPSLVPNRMERSLPTTPGAGQTQAWVDTLLARPLFAQDRRTAKPGTVAALAGVELPRLAGVMVSAQGSSAIFAAAGDGKGVVIGTGSSIGGFRVQKIEAGQVTLVGADGGTHLLRPSFDPRLVPMRADSPGPKSPAGSTVAAPRPRPAVVTRSAPPGVGGARQTRPGAAPPRLGGAAP